MVAREPDHRSRDCAKVVVPKRLWHEEDAGVVVLKCYRAQRQSGKVTIVPRHDAASFLHRQGELVDIGNRGMAQLLG
jgi:hypothetical protein